jgi:hypothetical protein
MENEMRKTCAIMDNTVGGKREVGIMCKHCSTAKFDPRNPNPYWTCEKYRVRLVDDENDKTLMRCEACLKQGI